MLQLVCLKVVFKVNISSSFVYWYLVIEAMVVMSWIRKEQNPEKYAKKSVSSLVQKCVPERPR
jgi:hypothetical protein